MARKINGPFGDSNIATIGQQGVTATNSDLFLNPLEGELMDYSDALSSQKNTSFVTKITRLAQLHRGSKSCRDATKNNGNAPSTWC
jgi:hypothetical protein